MINFYLISGSCKRNENIFTASVKLKLSCVYFELASVSDQISLWLGELLCATFEF